MTQTKHITDDLAAMLNVFPHEIAETVTEKNHFDDLLEVILDLGPPGPGLPEHPPSVYNSIDCICMLAS